MLKVTIYFDKEKKDKLVYEDVKDIYIYPDPQAYTDEFLKSYGIITQIYSSIKRINYYTQIYKKPYMVVVEPQPIKIMEI